MEAALGDETLDSFETIWANVECGVSLIDAETREIIDINPVAVRMFEGDKADIIGMRCHNFICPAEEDSCPIIDKNQVVDRSERKFIKANGEVIPIIKSVAKINYKGRLTLLESFIDISNLKKAEEQLRIMTINEHASQAKSDFLSRMSHEMRTPLNAIIGMTKIAENTQELEKLAYCLSTIGQSATHLLGLINDILDMSKIEAGKFELSSIVYSLEEVIAKMCNLVMEQVENKNIRLNVFLDKDACRSYYGDELRLSQVLTNLMSNAVKFTPNDKEISVYVTQLECSQGKSLLRFAVEDTGIGMTPEQMGKLFTSFEQGDTSITRHFGGTGLGLAISKSIVEMMGGRIWAESELDSGSTFTFELELEHASQPPVKSDCTDLEGMHVLVASNDKRIGQYFLSVTQDCGVATTIATDAGQLFSLMHKAQDENLAYDMVFVDYNLHCDDIIELLATLGAQSVMGIIVVMASFLTWNRVDVAVRDAGINRFIPLPLLPSSIIRCLRRKTGITQNDLSTREVDPLKVPDFSEIRILLAEDIEINREIFMSLLENTGIKVDIAENGLVAVERFSRNMDKYSLIIMDVHMPELNGLDATRQIRAMDAARAKEIPIIAMTADVFSEDVDRCLASGMNDHLGKPIDYNAVIDKISLYTS